jgi:hypothetical protein
VLSLHRSRSGVSTIWGKSDPDVLWSPRSGPERVGWLACRSLLARRVEGRCRRTRRHRVARRCRPAAISDPVPRVGRPGPESNPEIPLSQGASAIQAPDASPTIAGRCDAVAATLNPSQGESVVVRRGSSEPLLRAESCARSQALMAKGSRASPDGLRGRFGRRGRSNEGRWRPP